MRQFLLPGTYRGEPTLTLTGKDFHYLCRVRRVRPGDRMKGIDSVGSRYLLQVTAEDDRSCTLAVEKEETAAEPETLITLFQCLPKGKKLDLVIRQVTEAGISRIVPVESERSVRRLDEGSGEKNRQERWNRIAREALQQSGTSRLPEILPPVRLSEIPSLLSGNELGLFFHQEKVRDITLHGLLSARPSALAYVVGPEGGLADREVEFLQEHGFMPVFLGRNILRTETAALYGLAAIQLVHLEIDSWKPT